MTTEQEKKALLDDFQRYLQQTELNMPGLAAQPDLNKLFAEMSGLKAEVKAESRQFKNTLDSLNTALTAVQDEKQALSAAYKDSTFQLQQKQQTMLLDMVDMYERLSIAMDMLQHYRPSNRLFNKSIKKDIRFIDRYKDGQQMTLRRFEQMLHRYQVSVIECVGRNFDPALMTAVETVQDPKFENGVVVDELRKGFRYQDQVLRPAEVKVNKLMQDRQL